MSYTFRVATLEDVPWIMNVAHAAYGERGSTPAAEAWVRESFLNPTLCCFLGKRSFAFVQVYRAFWEPKPVAWLMFFGARPGRDLEPLALARHVAAYAKARGCASIHAGSETASDVTVFMRRLGARPYELFKLEL